jgi:hypothetical protein
MLFRQFAFKIINEFLETTWSDYQVKYGKEIILEQDWNSQIDDIKQKYLEAGWIIKHKIEIISNKKQGIYHTLIFFNPAFIKKT